MESGSALGRVWPQAKGSDPAPLLSPGIATSEVLCPVLGSQCKKDKELQERVQQRPQRVALLFRDT